MWRRLCIDVNGRGDVIGASIEHWTDSTDVRYRIVALSPSFYRGVPLSQLVEKLEQHFWSTETGTQLELVEPTEDEPS